MQLPLPIASYRLRSALARLRYESDRAESLLDWIPRVGVHEGIRRILAHGRGNGLRLVTDAPKDRVHPEPMHAYVPHAPTSNGKRPELR